MHLLGKHVRHLRFLSEREPLDLGGVVRRPHDVGLLERERRVVEARAARPFAALTLLQVLAMRRLVEEIVVGIGDVAHALDEIAYGFLHDVVRRALAQPPFERSFREELEAVFGEFVFGNRLMPAHLLQLLLFLCERGVQFHAETGRFACHGPGCPLYPLPAPLAPLRRLRPSHPSFEAASTRSRIPKL